MTPAEVAAAHDRADQAQVGRMAYRPAWVGRTAAMSTDTARFLAHARTDVLALAAEVAALTVERDAARGLACDLVSQQPGPSDDAWWAELDEPDDEDGIRAATLVTEILILDTDDGWIAFAWGDHDLDLFRGASETVALQSTGEPHAAVAVRSGVAEECDQCAAAADVGSYVVLGGPHLDGGADDAWEHSATCTDDECDQDCAGRQVSPHGGGRRGVATWACLSIRETGS